MKKRYTIPAGIIIIALLFSVATVSALEDTSPDASGNVSVPDDIAPYQGPIGADSPLFGLKLAMENLDETFTFNDTQRVEKQVDHAQTRIAEIRQELELNRTVYAERALEEYGQKMNLTEGSLARFGQNASGLLHAQEMITWHQSVLARLFPRFPNSSGLAHAYNDSQVLEQKFGEKTRMRFDRYAGKNNRTVLKAVNLEIRDKNHAGADTPAPNGTKAQGRNETSYRSNDKTDMIQVNGTVTNSHQGGNDTPSETSPSRDDKGSSKDQGKKGRN